VEGKVTILVIDDERLLRKSLKKILEKAGFYVETALDYQSAKARVKEQNFDLLLVDIILPKVNGLQLIEKLQGEIEGFSSSVIFFTGEPNLESSVKALRLGALEYLEKPVPRKNLISAIRNVLKKRNYQIKNAPSVKKTLDLDEDFFEEDQEEEISDLMAKTQNQLQEIYQALAELKEKYGDSFNEDQRRLLNVIAKNNNEMRKIWND